MPWLEKKSNELTFVRVVELRRLAIWERSARGKKPGRGRVSLVGEHQSRLAAKSALKRRVSELELEGYSIVDSAAGVDDLFPRGREPVPDARLTADDLARELQKQLVLFGDAPTVNRVVAAFESAVFLPRRYRARGFRCDLLRDFPDEEPSLEGGSFFLCIMLASGDGYWRELGYNCRLRVPPGRETTSADLRAESGTRWQDFKRSLQEDEAWLAIADLSCLEVSVEDDDID